MMRLWQVLFVTVICLLLTVWACEEYQKHNGCKIDRGSCVCEWGCKSEFIYKSKRICRGILAATPAPPRNSNICSRKPCLRGNCIQTMNDIGFTCKCVGTGYYGQRCEKACPTTPIQGVFPHECIVI